ncbi:Signal transduction histidine kinase [Saccharopolyspora shandongensis]|uniref:histidine kinase n=1 Tax=Saccharopolyspora shandongensis TaxID=418495 RepID=A0A1H3QSC6_9PSEU|nr:HAMP domain-containing sensor histidine kinase [Saccharopolyspora shandongensis]SDZ16327.1 Signal transduction histidine kinase [Saccharopolyspora shandongensis]
MHDLIFVALVSLWCSVAVGLLGAWILWFLRRGSLVVMMMMLAVITVISIGFTFVVLTFLDLFTVRGMTAVLLACIPTAAVSVMLCLLLGRRILHGSRNLARATRTMGEDGRFAAPAQSGSAELAVLTQELAATSAALTASREQEQLLEASRRQLIAWVSHDLRTPLAGLRAMTEALQDGMARDQDRYLGLILQETQRLDHLVGDLFDLSRIQSNSLTLSLTPVSLADLISDAVTAIEPQARSRGVRLVPGGIEPVAVRVDIRQINRVLGNLLSNAVRHTHPGGAVTVCAHAAEGRAVLSISDACGGIPEADLHKVFEPGWRGTPSRPSGKDVGGGLGLAIVRGIIEAHHGGVAVRNVEGGCQFTASLPLAG